VCVYVCVCACVFPVVFSLPEMVNKVEYISHCWKLTVEDLSRYLNKIESVGLIKAYC